MILVSASSYHENAGKAIQDIRSVWRAVELANLTGGRTIATAVNNEGAIVGLSTAASGRPHAVLWTKEDRRIMELHPTGFAESAATAINNHGQVLLNASNPGVFAFFIWSRGEFTEIVAPPGFTIVTASGINDSGRVVGSTLVKRAPHGLRSSRR